MRKIFIDCGAHKATTARVVLETLKDFQIHSFETNPEFFQYFDGLNIILHKKAVWIHNKSINFFPAENSYAGSLYKDKKTGNIIKEPIKVDCVDLSKWIIENFELDDYITCDIKIIKKLTRFITASLEINDIFDKAWQDNGMHVTPGRMIFGRIKVKY